MRKKNNNVSGVSTQLVDSKWIQKTPYTELNHFFEPKQDSIVEQEVDWLIYTSKQTINNDSLNERFDYSHQKEIDTYRIITLGDSFTYGSYINTEDNWTELLEDYLNAKANCKKVKKYEVINLGVWAYDWAYESKRFELRGLKYKPDLVISLIVDFGRVSEHRFQNQNKIVLTKEQINNYRRNGNYYPDLSIIDKELTNDFRISYQQKYINKFISMYRGPLLLVDFEKNPLYSSTIKNVINTHKEIFYEKINLSWRNKEYFLPDMHPNIEGHKKLMKEIVGYLIKNNLIPCK